MNLIPLIAEKLGVKIEEEFKIKNGFSAIYKFQGSGLYTKKQTEDSYWCVCKDLTLRDILVGIAEIEKLPLEPKNGERYYYVRFARNSEGKIEFTIFERVWEEEMRDYENKLYGNRFRTLAEAKFEAHNVYKQLTGRECEKWQ